MTQGERVRAIRKSLNLTLEKFGEKLGVGKTAISKIEKGENDLTEQMKRAICREYGVDYIFLTTGEGELFVDSDDSFLEKIDHIMAGENEFHKKLIKWCVTAFDDDELLMLEKKIDSFVSEFSKKPDDGNTDNEKD